MSVDPATKAPTAPVASRAQAHPVAIEVRGLEKSFRIPTHRIDTFKERALHPFSRNEYRELRAIRDMSFDIHRGEFFGVVGKNGSGKSTLLKVLASIYRADAGRVRIAGRVAPFIELGVGFNYELTARENVVLNGVMMGLPRREAQRRLDAVLDFAELRDFVDLKLKNYSSGMMVRLAFSVMIQAEADVLLIDEVLAVGDAAFQEKCAAVFEDMRRSDRTIVLVTHDMTAIEAYCDRGMLIDDGELRYIGDPQEVGRRYYRQNWSGAKELWGRKERGVPDLHAAAVDAWLEDAGGQRVESVEPGEPLRLRARLRARHDLVNPEFGFECKNVDGVTVFSFKRPFQGAGGGPNRLAADQVASISATVEQTLVPGTYYVRAWVVRDLDPEEIALQFIDILKFEVAGGSRGPGIVAVDPNVEIEAEGGEGK
jgi:ABC-type polysaccharide/polyol phosphate transport system ATPase subunit